jgi:hypothetical protein
MFYNADAHGGLQDVKCSPEYRLTYGFWLDFNAFALWPVQAAPMGLGFSCSLASYKQAAPLALKKLAWHW